MMNQAELRQRLIPILNAEESEDWDVVERLSDELNRELLDARFNVPEIVDHYLDDADVRIKDSRYAEGQRAKVRQFVETGEHTEGTTVPLWCCALVAALFFAAVIWLVR